ncbi:elongation factor P [Candidatus Uhrbacteria bacterium RIFCSPHIGHO2_02_FULL_47_44]|uniref:Elongation factor P n=1 Tax=Candidatus Uhrbacteria bacterium RIFCSPLOWO2_02_FULL_48_18 TaxID=1802408 RepID=A0A1F7VE43_9BACT|nr:MAG: elongation factor P [Candidatus Uhrbacteria bacterium RIFCSPHIGHO2_01_FULL_47_10]OGL71938.1 MAG: elongation factor P [Candidatus Uhrbacteria bacterium RIFCSPHIGHO2_02_FULL_47_44]OGL76808.1 MAG: elongation factor P [Candidatus Uhrbacteria bacterium RIFCSPHIGHO2_12_FULL_47_12]OGL80563.1 MAG: elongation factor P [Candidatus Uhrbacteria bacterium RIFCSPLOWO2_01_FULL_47_17]OGL88254.1 MAG: elongation factor P [Candidatus Uhrbacteria bacterium RIFCSPLOWO2_02_FULL_48_18]OGL92971.1 MAG: elongat
MASPNDIKKSTVIRMNGELWVAVDFQRVSPGKGSSFVRTRLRNLKSGKVIENNFKSAETLEFEDVQYKKMQYLFNDGNLYTFMDNGTYEQVSVGKAEIAEFIPYLKEGLDVTVVMHEGNALTIALPQKIQYRIAYAEPAVKGDTASGNVTKEADLDNGLKMRVPMFINTGDEILVNTDSGTYVERVSK